MLKSKLRWNSSVLHLMWFCISVFLFNLRILVNMSFNYRYKFYFIIPLWRFVSWVSILKFCLLSQTRYLFCTFISVFVSLFVNFLHTSQLFRMVKYYEYDRALVNRIKNLSGHKMRETVVWLKKRFLLKNELVKFVHLNSIHIRALQNNLINNTNKCTVLQFAPSHMIH